MEDVHVTAVSHFETESRDFVGQSDKNFCSLVFAKTNN